MATPGSSPTTENNSPTSAAATPDPLNTAFINDTTVSEHSQQSLSSTQQDQGYNTIDTSTVNSSYLEALIESPAETIDLRTPSQTTATPTSTPAETIDLTTPTPSTIDLCTPTTIDLCTPEASNTNTGQNKGESPLRLKPK